MIFTVPDMTCNRCKAAIETEIAKAGGAAQIDLDQHLVTVQGIDPRAAEQAIRDAGYSPTPG